MSSSSTSVESSLQPSDIETETHNICHRCKEPIEELKFIVVKHYNFHQHHFTCAVCDCQLIKFRPHNGEFYCPDHFVEKFYQTCMHCKEPILTGNVLQACGNYYHENHFVCVICHISFEQGSYYEHENQPYCEEHFPGESEHCSVCGKEVGYSDEVMMIKDHPVHLHCVKCAHCHGLSFSLSLSRALSLLPQLTSSLYISFMISM